MFEVLQGDCLELMKTIPDKSVDCIICDLPYGTTACKWDSIIDIDDLWKQYNRIIKPIGNIVLFGSDPFSTYLKSKNLTNYKYDIVWIKNIKTNFTQAKRQPLRQYETISIFYKKHGTYNPQMIDNCIPTTKVTHSSNGNIYTNNSKGRPDYEGGKTTRYPSNIIYYDVVDIKHRLHPSQKPLELLEYLVKTYTNEDDLVLDNCMGSGTTGIACIKLDRNFIGIEKDETYFNIAKDRLENFKY